MNRSGSDGEFSERVNKFEDRLTRLPCGKASDDMLGAGALHDVAASCDDIIFAARCAGMLSSALKGFLCMTRRKGRTMAYYKKISVEIRQK